MSLVTTFNRAGMVKTGFSLPYVAKYVSDGAGGVTYTDRIRLARGVSVEITPNVIDESNFSADNGLAESDGSYVADGTAVLTCDGLLPGTYTFVTGAAEPGENDKFQKVGDTAETERPELGVAYIVRWKCGGVTLFNANVLARCKYVEAQKSAQTQEYNAATNWQTSPVNFHFSRAETAEHEWLLKGRYYTTEAEAEADILELFTA